MPKDLDDPTFKHGTDTGYGAGCRRDYPCPGTPTCTEAHSLKCRRRREQTYVPPTLGQQTVQVRRRLAESVAAVGYAQVLERSGLTDDQVQDVLTTDLRTLPPEVAEPLDHAWTWFVKGVDSLAPDFKHGVAASYRKLGCRCVKCRLASHGRSKKTAAGGLTSHKLVHVPGLADHVAALLADPAVTVTVLKRAAGVHVSAVHGARSGARVRAGVARKLLAVTPAAAAAAARLIPADDTRRRLRSMWALGYPLAYIAAEAGVSTRHLADMSEGSWVHVDSAVRIHALADRIGDTPATPEATGSSAATIKRTRTLAQRAGVYPPAFYDEDGNVDPRTIPGHRWSLADDRCADALALAYAVAKGDKTQAEIAAQFGGDHKPVQRMVKRLGVWSVRPGVTGVHPESRGRAAWIRRMIEDYNDGVRGPVEVALAIGARSRGDVPRDHPEVVAYDEAVAAAQERTRAAAGALAYLRFQQGRVAALVTRVDARRHQLAGDAAAVAVALIEREQEAAA